MLIGGSIVFSGSPKEIQKSKNSITGQYLTGKKKIDFPLNRRKGNGKYLQLTGASGNNLKNVDISFPLSTLVVVTGVSGSGKSTLINSTLYPSLAKKLNNKRIVRYIKNP